MGSGEHAASVNLRELQRLQETPPWEWPKNAGRVLRDVLLDRQASFSDRMLAAELGSEFVVINDSLAKALLTVVGGAAEPEELRARAAISLGPALDHADTFEFEDPEDVRLSEGMFNQIQETLEKLYRHARTPNQVRRRVLEASVRAPQDWHVEAIRKAYSHSDREWVLTAAFAMRFVEGFDEEILKLLKNLDPEIQFEAVMAAGSWGLEEAWTHVADLVGDDKTPKRLLLAAIEAVGGIHPNEAEEILSGLAESDDEEIAEAVEETLSLAHGADELDEEEWIN